MAKESMDQYAKRRGREREAKANKDSPDSKGPGPNGWTKGAGKKPKGC